MTIDLKAIQTRLRNSGYLRSGDASALLAEVERLQDIDGKLRAVLDANVSLISNLDARLVLAMAVVEAVRAAQKCLALPGQDEAGDGG